MLFDRYSSICNTRKSRKDKLRLQQQQNFILNVINMEGTTLNWLRSHPIRWFEYIFIPKLN